MAITGDYGKNFINRFACFVNGDKQVEVAKTGQTENTTAPKQVEMTKAQATDTDLASTVDNISNRAKVNTPEAQGLASAEDVRNGKLVSGYTFDNLGEINTKLFDLKYNSANAPRIAQGTNTAIEGIEYAGVASHLQDQKNNPYIELFA
jgi:hypothetical protein